MSLKRLALFGTIALALQGLALAPSRADILILDDGIPGVPRGTRLSDREYLNVPSGHSVMVMRPSGVTQDIVGPRKVVVREVSKGEPIGDAFARMLREFGKPSTGNAVGVTRDVPSGGTKRP